MSLETPTLQEINNNIISQLEQSLAQSIPLLPKAFLRVLAKVLAAVFIILYKYCGFIFLQMFISSASSTETTILGKSVTPLVEWGNLIGIGPPIPATNAELFISVTVINQVGNLPAGTTLRSNNNNFIYSTLSTVSLDEPTVNVNVRAISDQSGGDGSGTGGNLIPADILTFVSPIANVERNAVVLSQTVTGANQEDPEIYRQRVLTRFQQVPQGGAYSDYRIWGLTTPGIVNIYPYTGNRPGEVDVYAEATEASSGSPDGIPTPAQLLEVFNNIELDQDGLATRRPANAFVNTYAIKRLAFEVDISGVTAPNVGDAKVLITDALKSYFSQREPFISGLDSLPRLDRITSISVAAIIEDILDSVGGSFDSLQVKLGAGTVSEYILGQGEKAKTMVVYI